MPEDNILPDELGNSRACLSGNHANLYPLSKVVNGHEEVLLPTRWEGNMARVNCDQLERVMSLNWAKRVAGLGIRKLSAQLTGVHGLSDIMQRLRHLNLAAMAL